MGVVDALTRVPHDVGMDWLPLSLLVIFGAWALRTAWAVSFGNAEERRRKQMHRLSIASVRITHERDGFRIHAPRTSAGLRLKYRVRTAHGVKDSSVVMEPSGAGQFVYTGTVSEEVAVIAVVDMARDASSSSHAHGRHHDPHHAASIDTQQHHAADQHSTVVAASSADSLMSSSDGGASGSSEPPAY